MKIWGGAIEKAVRAARDRYIVGPLARSRLIQRYAHFGYDYSIKVMNDHLIAYNPRERGAVGSHLRQTGEWCRDDFRAVLSMLGRQGRTTKDKVFVDVGANVGTQTVYALTSDDFASAIAIEPQPDNLAILNINLLLNRLTDRVIVVKCAAGSKHERRSLVMYNNDCGRHTLVDGLIPLHDQRGSIEVDVERVEVVLQQQRIMPSDVGLVLLDVEGFEPDAIAGFPQLLEAQIPLFMEVNSHIYGEAASAALLKRLSQHYSCIFSPGVRGLHAQTFRVSNFDKRYLPGDLLFV